LVKYADANEYLVETAKSINHRVHGEHREEKKATSVNSVISVVKNWCDLIDYDKDGEDKILAAAIYRFGEMAYADALEHLKSMKEDEREKLAETLLGKLGKYDIPLRELEYSTYTFDLVMDQGAYAEFKRHRMMTQTPQRLTTRLGYTTPLLITEAGFTSKYEAAMEAAHAMYEKLHAFHPDVAQYIVPNGFNRRVLAQFNLREAFAFCQLRTAANAHFSIRRVAQKMYEDISSVHPLLSKYMKLREETWQSVEENYFSKI
jgi:hypothetical protein